MELCTDEEKALWQATLLAYLQRESPRQGSHLKFADRVVEAFRVRTRKSTNFLEKFRPLSIPFQEFASIVKRAVETSHNKIPAIKVVREKTGMGLIDAKDAVEAYVNVYPNPSWKLY